MDVRRINVKSWFVPTVRGLLRYPTLQRYVDDVAEAANINKPLPGGQEVNYYNWTDTFVFAQDEWRVHPSLTLSIGLRYELPGNSIDSLVDLNQQILDAAGGDQRFALTPVPEQDKNNFQPRLGFNWNPQTSGGGDVRLAHGRRQVRRCAAATRGRTITRSSTSPSTSPARSRSWPRSTTRICPNAFTVLPTFSFTPTTNPNLLTRTVVADDFRSPEANQYSFEMQRELTGDTVLRVGYIGTQGRGLFQTLDGNPRQPFCGNPCTTGPRVDPTRGVIRLQSQCRRLELSLDAGEPRQAAERRR